MLLEDKKVFLPNVIVYRQLKSDPNLLICSGEITLEVMEVLKNIRLRGPEKDEAEVYVPRNKSTGGIPYQREGAWNNKDRKELLSSIFQGLATNTYQMYYRGGAKGPRLIEIMDGANRIETQRSFIFRESIVMPNGKETPRLKVETDPNNDQEPASTFEELLDLDKEKFENHRIRINLYFVLNKNDIDYDENNMEIVGEGLPLLENCVEIKKGSDEAKECEQFCAIQFIAFNKGRQNNKDENRRANPVTTGVMSRTIDDICKDFDSDYYGFNVKRAAKQNYIAEIAYTIWKGDTDFLGKATGKDKQIDELYTSHKESSKDVDNLIRDLRYTIDNLKKTHKIYREKQNIIPSKFKSFATGDCFTHTDGFLLTSFMFNEVFKNYVIKENDDDYLEIGQICSDLYSGVSKHFNDVKKAGGILNYDRPKDDDPLMDRLSFEWYYAKTKHNGSMSRINSVKWNILKELISSSNLTPKTKRKHAWSDNKYSVLLDKAGYKCRIMGTDISKENCEVVHIVALEDGGTNDDDNLEVLSSEGHAKIDKHRHLKAA